MTRPRVIAASTVLAAASLATWALLCCRRLSPPCTESSGRRSASPIAAALAAFWRQAGISQPSHVALNVPPDIDLALGELRRDFGQSSITLTLFRDTSWFASAVVSPESLRALKVVYDVRPLTPAEWVDRWAAFSSAFHSPTTPPEESAPVSGTVFLVAHETCRGWPCHGDTYVEVRRSRGGYLSCRVLLQGVE